MHHEARPGDPAEGVRHVGSTFVEEHEGKGHSGLYGFPPDRTTTQLQQRPLKLVSL